MRKFLLLIMILLFFSASAFATEEQALSDEELTQLLYELSQQQEEAGEFLVVPEDYQIPAEGLDGVYRLLIIGVDTDNRRVSGRSDTMILATLNKRQHTLKLVSFMRDMFVPIPGHGHGRLNAAYVYGGPELLKKTLEKNFQVSADGYIAVNFSLMADMVDAIGGIQLYVAEDERKPLNGILEYYNYQRGVPEKNGVLAQAGDVTLSGLQAMSYARIRKMDSDFNRVERQQKVMAAIYQKMGQAQSGQLIQMMLQFIEKVRTDVPMTTALGLAGDLANYTSLEISSLRIPIERSFSSKMVRGAYILVPNMKKNSRAIGEFLGEVKGPTP